MSEDQKKQLEQQLWNIANTLRGKMNADEFRDYILGFIFYKYLAEKMDIYANNILKADKIKYKEIKGNTKQGKEYIEAIKEESLEKLGYFLKPSELFSEVAKRGNSDVEGENNFILEDLQKILNNIQLSTMGTESEEDFDHLFEDMDLNSTKLGKTPEARNEIIAKVLSHLDKIDFKLEQTELDVLGDAYEYLIGQFASGAGKKAGEFYTPQEVSKVLAKIVTTGKSKLKSVYDPTCGSGSLLLRVAKEVKEVSNFYGQELNRTTYNLARMNMILHGVHYRKFDIKQEDTLEHPQHNGKQFEAIVANPPFSAQWSANPLFTSDDRFSQYGKLAPASKADFAFVQHMIHHLAENGTMCIVLPLGVLFRGGAERHIRKYLIEDRNYLDAVIGLPPNIFYGAIIPTCILVFKKCRETPEDILFIDASREFEQGKTQNFLRDIHIDNIIKTYRNRTESTKYSKRVTLSDVFENDFNLNMPRYINLFENEKVIDINKLASDLEDNADKITDIEKELERYCSMLKIPKPTGYNLSLLEHYKNSILQMLFNQKIRFKAPNNKDFPKWEKQMLEDILIKYDEKTTVNNQYPVLTSSRRGIFLQSDYYNKQIASEDNTGYNIVPRNYFTYRHMSDDLIFRFNINNIVDNGIVSTLYPVFTTKNIDDNFLRLKLNNGSEFKKYAIIQKQGGSRTYMYFNKLQKLELELPSIDEQKLIAGFANAIEQKIDLIKSSMENEMNEILSNEE
jgi:type I restriction enzyme M protein